MWLTRPESTPNILDLWLTSNPSVHSVNFSLPVGLFSHTYIFTSSCVWPLPSPQWPGCRCAAENVFIYIFYNKGNSSSAKEKKENNNESMFATHCAPSSYFSLIPKHDFFFFLFRASLLFSYFCICARFRIRRNIINSA